MSEYQRYEFMTRDQPLTRAQLSAVNNLSSHIKTTSTHALIEYNRGDFKHDPIHILHEFFDGFLYWANWGTPRLALRFPHGRLPANLIDGYDFADFVTFTRHPDYDILDIHLNEWVDAGNWSDWNKYELEPLISIRDELLEGDLRSLYIIWLGTQVMTEGYSANEDYSDDDDEKVEEDEKDEDVEKDEKDIEEDDEIANAPAVPPAFATLTEAQLALAEFLQVPRELLTTVAQHSNAAPLSLKDDFDAWIELLPAVRRHDYLLRLAHKETGLSSLLIQELRILGQANTPPPVSEHVPYSTLFTESKVIGAGLQQELHAQEQLANQRHLTNIYAHQDDYWSQIEQTAARSTGTGYDKATELLLELREATDFFDETQAFQERFLIWVRPHLRHPALLKRLKEQYFSLPEV